MLNEALWGILLILAAFLGYRFALYRRSSELSFERQLRPIIERLKSIASIPSSDPKNELQSLDRWLHHLITTHNIFKEILQNTHEGVLILQDEKIVFVNRAVMRMLDIQGEPEEWSNRPFLEFCRQHSLQTGIQEWKKNPKQQIIVLEMQTAVLEVTLLGILDNSLLMLLWQDITEIRKAETDGKELVANVAHQLRTPITAIQGYAETLLDNEFSDPKEIRQFLEIILRNSKRLSRFIEDILTIAMLDRRGLSQTIDISIEDMMNSISEIVDEEAKSKGVKIIVQKEIGLDMTIHASSLIEQAILNVMHNAVKYTRSNSTVYVSITTTPKHLIFRIKDQGPGIPKDMQRLIFERFFRIADAASGQKPGSGLGLAIAKEVIVAHGGKIFVESDGEGNGSTFIIELPISTPV